MGERENEEGNLLNISLSLIFNYYNNATQKGFHWISARDCYFKEMVADQFEHSQNCFSVSLITRITHLPLGNRKKPCFYCAEILRIWSKPKIWSVQIFTWIVTDACEISVFQVMEHTQQEDYCIFLPLTSPKPTYVIQWLFSHYDSPSQNSQHFSAIPL